MAANSDSSRKARDSSDPEVTVDHLAQQVAALRDDLAAIGETLKALGLSGGHKAAAHAREHAEGARAAGEAQIEEMRRRLDTVLSEADSAARKNPATAMGLAAGVGFLVGLFLSRR
ncbi:DUF883 family protein [Rhodobaculum claviforme]|uniref:DUF883 domain-containing protein n=1 Tax=Rhodobaculum claviforme TaxID=1549854 RepID=A0A934TJH8_9RHOB|nr:DUF883 C-terminal domain-containing protein [Rhodobaculum claviforme]MBK5927305.1 hypothetical protein [Rhodobaculum claviforme]